MSESISIHAHYDGKVLVPDEPLDLKVDQTVIIEIHQQPENKQMSLNVPAECDAETGPWKNPAEFTAEEQLEALKTLVNVMKGNPDIPLDATRRINLYEDSKY